MLQRVGSKYRLYPHEVTYTKNGEEYTKWALPDKQWWTETAEKHDRINIVEFTEVEVTADMQKRFKEIERMPEGFGSVYQRYVLDGTLPDNFPINHPFRQVIAKNEDESQGQSLIDAEIENMSQGQQMTEMDLRISELEAK
ncbi:hypothetical protein [Salibacterium qingdaonense]|uniref:Uncharacterized protein n=1 Tax=Salibacterium qingdaonense TaxID=266892 RepID=A0A1I4KQR4_9BACI|nr:hypothetical protein [Salibacterium qingdaonense]SFL80963.1 hypothetical protein SAMN04488054_105162 [Salibacterium qingdaonense]